MAHILNDIINRAAGRKTVSCNDQCKFWKFPHLDVACVLSPVFAVGKGVPCFEFEPKSDKDD